jgi:energy-coupling factor transporter ATP-binding protein EcfA2
MADTSNITRPNPFPGLRAFRSDEGHLFFGRMESVLKVVTRLKENRFVGVIGATGSGKSSLVLAGVIPALLRENAEGKKSWSYIVFKPEHNPVDNLATEIAALSASAGFTQLTEASIASSLRNRSEGLTDVVNKIRKNLRQQIVIVIDQFEEIFRYNPASARGTPGDDATDFIDLLVNAVQQLDQGLHVILTLRSEYVSECSRFHSLTSLLNISSYLLPQMSHDMITVVIEEPMKASGVTIDRSLVNLILADLPDRPGQLPVLQHLLMRLWYQWSKMGDMSRPVSIADYEAVGQLKGAISQHAGQALESLDERHRYVCSRLFRTITVRTDDGKEIRRPESIASIVAQTGCTTDEIMHVADVFRSPEYSFITPPKEIPLKHDTIIDLTHESIIKLWPVLRSWLDDEETSRRLYMRLASAAEQYQEGKGRLWTAPDLQIAVQWREENNPTLAWAENVDPAFERTMLFLKNSEEDYAVQEEYNRKAGRKKIKRSRFFAGLLGLLTVVAMIALGVIYSLRNKAEKQKEVAVQLKNEAVAYNTVLSDSLRILSDTLRTVEQDAVTERTNALMASDQADKARRKAQVADRRLQEAVAEKTSAVVMAEEENRLKMLKMARSLAVRSLYRAGEKDLQILLAWQAYLFNERNSGITDDADIFSALYDVSKRYGNKYYVQFRPDDASVTAMTEEVDGHFFYTADTQGRVLRWQTDQPEQGYKVIWSDDKIITVMAVSPDASWLSCGTTTSEIIMIPLQDDTISYQLSDGGGIITALLFSEPGDQLYSSTSEGMVNVWDLQSREHSTIVEDLRGITALDISKDNFFLAGLTREGTLLLWHNEAPYETYALDSEGQIITSMKFIPGSNHLAAGDDEGIIDIWNITDRIIETRLEGHQAAITFIAFNSRDAQMLTSDQTGEIKLWAFSDLTQPPVVITDSEEDIIHMSFRENGKAFLTATGAEVTERPAHVSCMTDNLCSKVTRNLSPQEWSAYVGRDIEYEPTCPGRTYQIRVREIRGGR